jgi:deazaflavin-dependent oxidoreductase (nitroreductase family)
VVAKLRYVDPPRQPNVVARAYAALAATRLSRFVSRHVSWKLDPLLLRATRGRVATTFVLPTAVLETTGARNGARRRNAIIYFHDGNRVTIVASNAGSPRHPSWYHNLRARPVRSTSPEESISRSLAPIRVGRRSSSAPRSLTAAGGRRRGVPEGPRSEPSVERADPLPMRGRGSGARPW